MAHVQQVARLEAEIKTLKAELESVNGFRAEEMNVTRKIQVRLYMFAGQVQGLYDESIRLADSMMVRDI